MTWFDIVVFLLLAVVVWLESNRGFGRALFDAIGAVVVLKLSTTVSHTLATALPLSQAEAANDAIWLAGVFVILMVLVVLASRFLYETTLLSLDVLDPLVGGMLGVVSGLIVAHIFLRVMLLAYGDSESARILMQSFAGQELIQFRTFHMVLTALQNLGE